MEISTFNNTEFGEIRTIQKNGEVLFCGKDIAAALGYADPKKAIIQHCKENGLDPEKICVAPEIVNTTGKMDFSKEQIDGLLHIWEMK